MSEYIPIGWKNRLVEKPMTYRMVNNGDGTITLTRESGEVYEEGTAVNADNLNHMEDGIRRANEKSVVVDQEVSSVSPNPVSGAAVAAYAFPKDMIVATTVDPGAGAAVDYPDGTVILVYE